MPPEMLNENGCYSPTPTDMEEAVEEEELLAFRFDSRVMERFGISRSFELYRTNSLDFYEDGQMLVASTDDGSIQIFDCDSGSMWGDKLERADDGGVELLRTTKDRDIVLYANPRAQPWPDVTTQPVYPNRHLFNMLSLTSNQCIRRFRGHKERLLSVDPSSSDHRLVLTSSIDKSVCMWDTRHEDFLERCIVPGDSTLPLACFDPFGLIFAISASGTPTYVSFHDVRNQRAELFRVNLPPDVMPLQRGQVSQLAFSACGQYLLANTTDAGLYVVDTMSERLMARVKRPNRHGDNAAFSAYGLYLIAGDSGGAIHHWPLASIGAADDVADDDDGQRLADTAAGRQAITHLRWNGNEHLMFATATSDSVDFWTSSN